MGVQIVSYGTNPRAVRVRYTYTNASGGTRTLHQGEPMCFNYDTTVNWCGYDPANGTYDYSTAEGYQNEGKFLIIEDPTTANRWWFAGVVAPGSWCGKQVANGSSLDLEVFIPNGAIVPVRTNVNCSVGATVLGIENGQTLFTSVTGDGTPIPCAEAEETVDRSGTNGLVLAKLSDTGLNIAAKSAYFAPVRNAVTGYQYGVNIDGTDMLTGTAASKSYVLGISGSRESAAATGDSNDAMLKLSGSNYGACDTNFVFAGINAVVSNRDGGTLGRITNTISVSLKQGSTADYAYGLQVDAQDLSENAKTEFGGLDIAINREGLAATTEFGMQLRTRGTINTAINTAIRITKDATDHGFVNLFNIETDAVDVIAASGDIIFTTSDKLIPIVFDDTTYYLVATDNV